MQTILTFNKNYPSRNSHRTWGGTFEPTLPFRHLSTASANRMNELGKQESLGKSLWIEKENRMCSCSHNSSGKLIPSHSQGWWTPPEDLIIPHFFPFWKQTLKKNLTFLEWKCNLMQIVNERHFNLKVHVVFLKACEAVLSATPTILWLKRAHGE